VIEYGAGVDGEQVVDAGEVVGAEHFALEQAQVEAEAGGVGVLGDLVGIEHGEASTIAEASGRAAVLDGAGVPAHEQVIEQVLPQRFRLPHNEFDGEVDTPEHRAHGFESAEQVHGRQRGVDVGAWGP
jgi:hypothetical protein